MGDTGELEEFGTQFLSSCWSMCNAVNLSTFLKRKVGKFNPPVYRLVLIIFSKKHGIPIYVQFVMCYCVMRSILSATNT